MPRSRSRQPAYQFHRSGQARVILGDKDFCLGKHGSDQSHPHCYALLQEYDEEGRQVPDEIPQHPFDEPITIRCVASDYRKRVLPR